MAFSAARRTLRYAGTKVPPIPGGHNTDGTWEDVLGDEVAVHVHRLALLTSAVLVRRPPPRPPRARLT